MFLIGWLICSFIYYGVSFAESQAWSGHFGGERRKKETYRQDLVFSLGTGLLFGYVGLFVILILTGFAKHGFKIK